MLGSNFSDVAAVIHGLLEVSMRPGPLDGRPLPPVTQIIAAASARSAATRAARDQHSMGVSVTDGELICSVLGSFFFAGQGRVLAGTLRLCVTLEPLASLMRHRFFAPGLPKYPTPPADPPV